MEVPLGAVLDTWVRESAFRGCRGQGLCNGKDDNCISHNVDVVRLIYRCVATPTLGRPGWQHEYNTAFTLHCERKSCQIPYSRRCHVTLPLLSCPSRYASVMTTSVYTDRQTDIYTDTVTVTDTHTHTHTHTNSLALSQTHTCIIQPDVT